MTHRPLLKNGHRKVAQVFIPDIPDRKETGIEPDHPRECQAIDSRFLFRKEI
jgi:hypothetical protein